MSKIAEGFLCDIIDSPYSIVELFNKSHFDLKDPVVRIWIKLDVSGWKQFYIIVCFRAFMPWRIGPCSKNLVRLGYIRMKTILCCNFPPFFLFQEKKAILNHVLNVWDKIRYLEEALFQTTTKKLFEKQTVSCLQRTDVNIDYGYSMSVSFSKTSSETVVES